MVLAVWGTAVAHADDPSPKEIYEKAAPGTVHVIGSNGSGTGFIYDSEKGLTVTNAHVVQGEAALKAVVENRQPAPVRVVGIDPCEDLAVLKFASPQKDLKELEFGDSGKVETADAVTALGYPESVEGGSSTQNAAFTSGAVQSRAVSADPFPSLPRYPALIQHSATLNPGNSGGPLLNSEGKVVGLNVLGYAGAEGQFYAIASDHAEPKLAALAAGEKKNDPGWLLLDLTDPILPSVFEEIDSPEDAAAFKDFQSRGIEGVMALYVRADSPAAKAKLSGGDVITTVRDEPVKSMAQICDILQSTAAGETLTLTGVYSGVLGSVGGQVAEEWTTELKLPRN